MDERRGQRQEGGPEVLGKHQEPEAPASMKAKHHLDIPADTASHHQAAPQIQETPSAVSGGTQYTKVPIQHPNNFDKNNKQAQGQQVQVQEYIDHPKPTVNPNPPLLLKPEKQVPVQPIPVATMQAQPSEMEI